MQLSSASWVPDSLSLSLPAPSFKNHGTELSDGLTAGGSCKCEKQEAMCGVPLGCAVCVWDELAKHCRRTLRMLPSSPPTESIDSSSSSSAATSAFSSASFASGSAARGVCTTAGSFLAVSVQLSIQSIKNMQQKNLQHALLPLIKRLHNLTMKINKSDNSVTIAC